MNSTGEELHPNWVALTTLHVPLKRFVPAGAAAQEKGIVEKYTIRGVSGDEIQHFYKEIIETPETKRATQTNTKCARTLARVKETPQLPFDRNRFFRLATSNNVEQLSQMCFTEEQQLNLCDAYGWTALMMAACEGAEDAVAWLLQLGADAHVADKSGNTALKLAKRKCHAGIVQLLETKGERVRSEDEPTVYAVTPFYCEVCERNYKESTWRAHQTSTVHQFNMKSLPIHKLQRFNIPLRNRGLQLMVKQGWDREHGLGPTQSGRLYPVKTVLRKQRTGLGIEQSPARVTHFQAFDTNATKLRHRNPPIAQPRRTRNDMKREKLREWKQERRLRSELS
ncbi:G patch domain and ankyrin repeat-containing protein 1 homolog [Drosophila grimshawi]|uniref:GH21459 n=1 Tax=Drosophila grimshawi TaxID=7222 RepID=B4J9R9_DROGR|nr:G patch domain and ankyrin repeat-containing protein 1 homolog [Drosophila grimshawi]EDW01483.1 GH21459 [Drosophila grimshawi]